MENEQSGAKQVRDMDLIRLLLLHHESGKPQSELDNYSAKEINYHYQLMNDAGLIVATFIEGNDEISQDVGYVRITWDGQDFLDSTRDNKVWKIAKDTVIKPGASWTFSLLLEYLKREAHQRVFGVPLHN